MKKRIRFLLFAGLVTCLFSACEKDEIEGIDPNELISVHGLESKTGSAVIFHHNDRKVMKSSEYIWMDEYTVRNDEGEIENHSDEVVGYTAESVDAISGNFMVGLYEEGILYDEHLGQHVGKGAVACLQLASTKTDELVSGEYKYEIGGAPNTFMGFACSYYDFLPATGDDVSIPIALNGGTVNISKNGQDYSISYDCVTTTGSIVKGKFSGVFPYIDHRADIGYNYVEEGQFVAAVDTAINRWHYSWGETYDYKHADVKRSRPLLISSKGQCLSGETAQALSDQEKRSVDLAVVYDKKTNSIQFVSPLVMRGIFWHGRNSIWGVGFVDYVFPCHTKVANNPDFSVVDYEGIQADEDFNFDVVEDNFHISLDDVVLPKIILFETGNGVKGALKINSISDFIEFVPDPNGSGDDVPMNPKIDFELKTQIAPAELKIK